MTKYILVGGYSRKAPDGGKALCEEIVRELHEPIKILDCLFARPEDQWAENFEEDQEFFRKHLPGHTLDMRLAQVDGFAKQIRLADAVYFRGGQMGPILEALSRNPEWIEELPGKTIIGSSAGAYAFAKYYSDLDTPGTVKEGLGILPIKVIVHYQSDYNAPNIDWDKEYAALKEYKEELPIIALREGEFKVYN